MKNKLTIEKLVKNKIFDKITEISETITLSKRMHDNTLNQLYDQIDFSDLEFKYFVIDTYESHGTWLLYIKKVIKCSINFITYEGDLVHIDSDNYYSEGRVDDWENGLKLSMIHDGECHINVELFEQYGKEVDGNEYGKELKQLNVMFFNLYNRL